MDLTLRSIGILIVISVVATLIISHVASKTEDTSTTMISRAYAWKTYIDSSRNGWDNLKNRAREYLTERFFASPASSSLSGCEVASGQISSRVPAKRTMTQTLGHAAFEEIISEYGGDKLKIKEGVVVNIDGNKILKFDSLFQDGDHKIALEFQHMRNNIFPNTFHKSMSEFENNKKTNDERVAIAARYGITLIRVPYVVDHCLPLSSFAEGGCSASENGVWKHESLSAEERKIRLKKYIHGEL